MLHHICTAKIKALTKSGLISESLSLWLKSPKKVPNHSPEHYPPKKAQESELTPFFGDMSQRDKLSEIKLPLKFNAICTTHIDVFNLFLMKIYLRSGA